MSEIDLTIRTRSAPAQGPSVFLLRHATLVPRTVTSVSERPMHI